MCEVLNSPRWETTQVSAIYFLMRGKTVMYVGQTADMHTRMIAHSKSGRQFTSIRYIVCPLLLLNDMEAMWQRRLNPPWNLSYVHTEGFRGKEIKKIRERLLAERAVAVVIEA
jgi:hypothetical protein